MLDVTQLIKLIKQAALQAVKADKPVEICFGKVISAEPLHILVDQKMTLGENQLILSRNVTDFETTVSIKDFVVDKLNITIHNALEAGDEVILIRQQGGQKYIVTDRIG